MKHLFFFILYRSLALVVMCISFTAMANPRDTVVITHAQGSTTIPAHPKRIVIFDPVILDIADVLNIDIAGVPQSDAPYPDYLSKYKGPQYINTGTLFEPDFEVLNRMKPDLIIAGGRMFDYYDKLSKIAPTIALDIDAKNIFNSLKQRTMLLGSLFNKQQQAEKLITDFNIKLKNVKSDMATDQSAMILLITGGKISEYPPKSRFGFIFDLLGFRPSLKKELSSGNHGNIVSSELILTANPEWLFVIDRDSAIGDNHSLSAKQVLDNPLIRKTTAWKRHQIIYLDSRALYISGGIQAYLRAISLIEKSVAINSPEDLPK